MRGVWKKIGLLDPDGFSCCAESEQIGRANGVALFHRRACDLLRDEWTGRRKRRKVVRAGERDAAEFFPVVQEIVLQLRDDRPVEFILGVAPMLGILRAACPVVCPARATAKTDATIHNEHTAVRAVVVFVGQEQTKRAVELDLHTGLFQQRGVIFVPMVAAERIENDVDFHASPCPLRKDFAKVIEWLTMACRVALECNAALCRGRRSQHGWEKPVPVFQRAHSVALGPSRFACCRHVVGKLPCLHRCR